MKSFVAVKSEFENLLNRCADELKACVKHYFTQQNFSNIKPLEITNISIEIVSLNGDLPFKFADLCTKYKINSIGYIVVHSGERRYVIFHFLINDISKQIFLLLKESLLKVLLRHTNFLSNFKQKLLQLFQKVYGTKWTIQFINLCDNCLWNLKCAFISSAKALHYDFITSLLFPICYQYMSINDYSLITQDKNHG